MPLYDFLAPAYDPVFEKIYLPFRQRALAQLPLPLGGCVLDLACGSGQNFPLLASRLGKQGHLIGLDISRGMLHYARKRSLVDGPSLSLIRGDATALTPALVEAETGTHHVDFVLCTYGFTGRALLHTACGSDPARFGAMRARFSKPTMPGDTLRVSLWDIGDQVSGAYRFRTETQRGETVIDAGLFSAAG